LPWTQQQYNVQYILTIASRLGLFTIAENVHEFTVSSGIFSSLMGYQLGVVGRLVCPSDPDTYTGKGKVVPVL
jgi:hypothetical protein